MDSISQGEKTEKATDKKRREERRKGNIFQSRDLSSALGLLGLFLFINVAAPYFYNYMAYSMSQYFVSFAGVYELSSQGARNYISEFVIKTLLLSLPFLLVTAGLGMALTTAQTRGNFASERLKPDFTKLDPVKGISKLFNLRSLAELVKSILKIVIVGFVVYGEIKNSLPDYLKLLDKSVWEGLTWMCHAAFRIVIKAGLFLLLFGILDYFYQWWEYERQIRMSHQDIKDEYKQTEGDPQLKGRIRERQRRMAMLRMAQSVPQADVVIKNPTHFAVAVKYDRAKDRAPKVIAKGQDYLALKIIEIADAH